MSDLGCFSVRERENVGNAEAKNLDSDCVADAVLFRVRFVCPLIPSVFKLERRWFIVETLVKIFNCEGKAYQPRTECLSLTLMGIEDGDGDE